MEREAWHAAVRGVAKSRTQLSDWTELKVKGYLEAWLAHSCWYNTRLSSLDDSIQLLYFARQWPRWRGHPNWYACPFYIASEIPGWKAEAPFLQHCIWYCTWDCVSINSESCISIWASILWHVSEAIWWTQSRSCEKTFSFFSFPVLQKSLQNTFRVDEKGTESIWEENMLHSNPLIRRMLVIKP